MYDRWSLDVFYTGIDDPKIEKNFEEWENLNADYRKKVLGVSSEDTVKAIEEILLLKEQILNVTNRLFVYFRLRKSANNSDKEGNSYRTRITELSSANAKEDVIFVKYIGEIRDLDDVIEKSELLKEYGFYLRNIRSEVEHSMDGDAEYAFSRLASAAGLAWAEQYSYLMSNTKFEVLGEKRSFNQLQTLAKSSDRNERIAAYEAQLAHYPAITDALAFSVNNIKLHVLTEAELRGYESPLEMTLAQTHIKRETVDAMWTAVIESFPKFREYLKHKAKLLGHKNGLPWYDIYQPVGNAVSKPYTVEEAHKYLVEHFASFSPDMSEMMDKAFKEDWIDFYSRPGKSGGAFCYGLTWFGEARILTNFAGNFGAVNTLAHELGHAFHSMQTKLNRPLNRLNPLPVSETASTFNEIFLMNDAIANAVGDDKIALLDKQITDALMILPDMYIRYRTEDELINRRRKGFVYADEINKLMTDTQKEVYGDALDNDYLYPYIWCDKSHYYSAKRTYYNYPYAFGGLFGRGLYAKYLEEGDSFVPKYREMLRQTPMKTVENAALVMGIDLSDVNFWRKSISTVCESIDLFIKETSK